MANQRLNGFGNCKALVWAGKIMIPAARFVASHAKKEISEAAQQSVSLVPLSIPSFLRGSSSSDEKCKLSRDKTSSKHQQKASSCLNSDDRSNWSRRLFVKSHNGSFTLNDEELQRAQKSSETHPVKIHLQTHISTGNVGYPAALFARMQKWLWPRQRYTSA